MKNLTLILTILSFSVVSLGNVLVSGPTQGDIIHVTSTDVRTTDGLNICGNKSCVVIFNATAAKAGYTLGQLQRLVLDYNNDPNTNIEIDVISNNHSLVVDWFSVKTQSK